MLNLYNGSTRRLLNQGLLDFHMKIDTEMHRVLCALDRGYGVVMSAFDSWKAVVKLMEAINEELLFYSERLVDSWIEEAFNWILSEDVHG